ncbi:MAG: glycosyltransferase family 39 protein, partial [Ilumatobacter fluminis]
MDGQVVDDAPPAAHEDDPTVDAPPPDNPDETPPDSDATPWWRQPHPVLVGLGLALMVGAMAALMFASHRPGHWWGDDWALYIRQAKSLVDGNPGAVTADNEFTVTESLGAPFSPPLYPWGFPLILAPFVAVVGVDVDSLAVVPVLSACVFACAWFVLVKRRLGRAVAFISTPAITLTPALFSWSELIQSEWPFLAVTFAMLVAVDWAVDSKTLTDVTARWWPLVLLGVGAAAAFSVRREGLAMTAAIGGAQLGLLTTGAPLMREWFRDRLLVLRV